MTSRKAEIKQAITEYLASSNAIAKSQKVSSKVYFCRCLTFIEKSWHSGRKPAISFRNETRKKWREGDVVRCSYKENWFSGSR